MIRMNGFNVIVVFILLWLGINDNCAGSNRNAIVSQEIKAYSDFVTGDEGQVFIIYVLNNDQGISAGISSLEIIQQPKLGVAEVVDAFAIKYTPAPGKVGADELWYKVCGKDGSCDEAKVIIQVLDYDFIPITNNDTVFIEPGEKSEVNVLTNDSNLFDLPLQLSIVTYLKNGDSNLDSLGLLTSTFNETYRGMDSLQYQVIDKEGDYNSAWVFFQINRGENDKIFIPQGISPNGDGLNDVFTIPDLQGNTMEIKVFDVLGQLVYSEANYANNWDARGNTGKYAGRTCDNGTYYFLLKVKGFKKDFSGFLHINK